MPNIEIYGQSGIWYVKDKMYAEVIEATHNLPFKNDIVITDLSSVGCYDRWNHLQPFIRVCDTEKKRMNIIVKVLKPLRYDIETLVLTGFYSGKK